MIARAEDASKISRIVERFNLASVDTASIVTEAEKSKRAKGKTKGEKGKTKNAKTAGEKMQGRSARARHRRAGKKAEKDRLMDALMGKQIKKEENASVKFPSKREKP